MYMPLFLLLRYLKRQKSVGRASLSETTSGLVPVFDIKLSVICGPAGDYWTDTADEHENIFA